VTHPGATLEGMTEQAVSIPRKWLDLLKGAIRTATPMGVGAAIAWLRSRGVVVPTWASPYVTGVAGGFLYWLVARLAEMKLSPKFGALLLSVGTPVYETASQALDSTTRPVLVEVPVDGPGEVEPVVVIDPTPYDVPEA
jgi:hypothetical protein